MLDQYETLKPSPRLLGDLTVSHTQRVMRFSIHNSLRIACLLIAGATAASGQTVPGENVLVLIADDLGIDRIQAYGFRDQQGSLIAPLTPNIDRLASSGVLFRTAWAAPACSSSRSSALSGLYPNRIGVGAAIGSNGSGSSGARDDFTFIPDLLPPGYGRAVLGKWHLAGPGQIGGLTRGFDHAPRCGFDLHLGTFANLGAGTTYFNWQMLFAVATNLAAAGETPVTNLYATTNTTDNALRMIESWGERPWLLWVAFNAPHKPYHVPPAHLFHDPALNLATDRGKGKAMIESLDTEIGRLLQQMDPAVLARTTIIFYGDNGTQKALVQPPFPNSKAKGTIFNGGVHVPLIVTSPRTPPARRGSECTALTDITDLLPTIVELCNGSATTGVDGLSLVPYLLDPALPSQRKWIFAERFKPNFVPAPGVSISTVSLTQHHQTARDDRYKLIRLRSWNGSPDTLFLHDVQIDYFETQNLLNGRGNPPPYAQPSFDRLLAVLNSML